MVIAPGILALYRDLRKIRFDPDDKPSLSENLTDVLEIAAVATAVKPAHLNGHGFRSGKLLGDLNTVARSHGLLTCRRQPHSPYWHRVPDVDPEYLAWQAELDREQAA